MFFLSDLLLDLITIVQFYRNYNLGHNVKEMHNRMCNMMWPMCRQGVSNGLQVDTLNISDNASGL